MDRYDEIKRLAKSFDAWAMQADYGMRATRRQTWTLAKLVVETTSGETIEETRTRMLGNLGGKPVLTKSTASRLIGALIGEKATGHDHDHDPALGMIQESEERLYSGARH